MKIALKILSSVHPYMYMINIYTERFFFFKSGLFSYQTQKETWLCMLFYMLEMKYCCQFLNEGWLIALKEYLQRGLVTLEVPLLLLAVTLKYNSIITITFFNLDFLSVWTISSACLIFPSDSWDNQMLVVIQSNALHRYTIRNMSTFTHTEKKVSTNG